MSEGHNPGHNPIVPQLDEMTRRRCEGDRARALVYCTDAIRKQRNALLHGRLVREFHEMLKLPVRLTPGEYDAVQQAVQGLPEEMRTRLRVPDEVTPIFWTGP
jgi:hypothetical protein